MKESDQLYPRTPDPSVDNLPRVRGIEDWVGPRDGLDQGFLIFFHTMDPIESLVKPVVHFSEKSI